MQIRVGVLDQIYYAPMSPSDLKTPKITDASFC